MRIFVILPVLVIFISCTTNSLLYSVAVRKPNEVNIEVFIVNHTAEALVLFIGAYWQGAEIARIPRGKRTSLSITRETKIYIAGGNTRNEYGEYICQDSMTLVVTPLKKRNFNGAHTPNSQNEWQYDAKAIYKRQNTLVIILWTNKKKKQ